MKKLVVFGVILGLMIPLFTASPVSADQFWSGVAVGVGSAIVLGQLLTGPRDHYYDRSPRGYSRPVSYYPSSHGYQDRWSHHGTPSYGSYGHYRWVGERDHRNRRY